MNLSIYLQTNFIPFLALCIIIANSKSTFASIPNIRRFQILTLFVIGSLCTDAFTWYLFAHTDIYPFTLLWAANIAYFILASATSWFWFLYVYHQINGEDLNAKQKRNLRFCMLPFCFVCIIILLSPWNHALFYINPITKGYERGTLHLVFSICIVLYLFIASFLAAHAARKELFLSRKKELYFLCYAALLPILGFVLQMINKNLIFLWPFISVALCLLYINFQQQKISVDALTSLNNRKSLERYLHFKTQRETSDWYFMMIDADDFKKINDRFGHIEGDRALKLIAQSLKNVLGSTSAFLSRYGGDEFAILLDAENELQVELLIQSIRDELWNLSRIHEITYDIQISAGYAKFINMTDTPPISLIHLADQKMYENKTERKQVH